MSGSSNCRAIASSRLRRASRFGTKPKPLRREALAANGRTQAGHVPDSFADQLLFLKTIQCPVGIVPGQMRLALILKDWPVERPGTRARGTISPTRRAWRGPPDACRV